MMDTKKIKFNDEFITYLSSEYTSSKSGYPLSPKVISDTLGRIKRVQRVLNINVDKFINTDEKFEQLCHMIKLKDSELRQMPTRHKYGYGRYMYAVRLYYKFNTWKNSIQ